MTKSNQATTAKTHCPRVQEAKVNDLIELIRGADKEDAPSATVISARTAAYTSLIPEVQLAALKSENKIIRQQGWMNPNLKQSVIDDMLRPNGITSEDMDDKEMSKIITKAIFFRLFARKEEGRIANGHRSEKPMLPHERTKR